MYALLRLLCIQEIEVDDLEEGRVQRQRLRDHLTIGQPPRADHLDPRQWRGGIENPEGGVVEVASRQQPFSRLVEQRQRTSRSAQQLHASVTLPDLLQPRAEIGDR